MKKILFSQLCMHHVIKNTTTSLGTVNETQMKFPTGNNKFPIFEIHHNNITSIIDIICVADSTGIHFMIDHISQDTGNYVSVQIMMIYNK